MAKLAAAAGTEASWLVEWHDGDESVPVVSGPDLVRGVRDEEQKFLEREAERGDLDVSMTKCEEGVARAKARGSQISVLRCRASEMRISVLRCRASEMRGHTHLSAS
eukprot:2317725-Rhodomonas_salina.1